VERSFTKFPNETRSHIGYPESCVGYLEAEDGDAVLVTGSAFLVHRQLALTCAHNCMRPDSRKEYPKLYLCLKRDNETIRLKIKKPHYLDGLFEGEGLIKSENYLDFAVLELEKATEDQSYLGLAFDYDRIEPTTVITVIGHRGLNN
jgi:hypothetical protein